MEYVLLTAALLLVFIGGVLAGLGLAFRDRTTHVTNVVNATDS